VPGRGGGGEAGGGGGGGGREGAGGGSAQNKQKTVVLLSSSPSGLSKFKKRRSINGPPASLPSDYFYLAVTRLNSHSESL